jgi:hypothetical protein
MTERSYQDAVQVLKERMGGQWMGVESEGRDEMVRILKDALGYDDQRANDTIDAMVDTGALRYHGDNDLGPAVPVIPPVGTGGTSTGGGNPVPAPVAVGGGGYWQIGEGVVESSGRKGQVTPT